ncbi:MAG: WecB/TagA/CpsF family glycosyltransferase [bacterium]
MYLETTILGIRVHKISRNNLEKEIVSALSKKRHPLFIATINPSFIIKAQKDVLFRDILNTKTTLNVPDGVGLKLADKNLEIITGVDITKFILSEAEKLNRTVLIVVREDSLTTDRKIKEYLLSKYPRLRFNITDASLAGKKGDVLFCALGEVAQEKTIFENIKNTESLVAVGVGGTFDVLTGAVKIPQTKHFGWFFRLLANPRRASKTVRSVLIFPLLLLFYRAKRLKPHI